MSKVFVIQYYCITIYVLMNMLDDKICCYTILFYKNLCAFEYA